MRLFITSDSSWKAKVDEVLDKLYDTGYTHFFEEQNYGSSLKCVVVVLMCQDPMLNLKRRVRFAKKEKTIYLDIMLDLHQFISINQEEREKIIAEKIITGTPSILSKYKLEDFNFTQFETDLKTWMSKILES